MEWHACGVRLSCPYRKVTLVVPAEVRWIIKRYSADPTSGSLTVGGACLSCPQKRNGQSNLAQRPRQAGPSESTLADFDGRTHFLG